MVGIGRQAGRPALQQVARAQGFSPAGDQEAGLTCLSYGLGAVSRVRRISSASSSCVSSKTWTPARVQAGGGHTGARNEMSREAAVVDFTSRTGWASRLQHRHANSQAARDGRRMFGAGDQGIRHVSAVARDDGGRTGEHGRAVTARALGWRTRNTETTGDLRAHADHASLRDPSLQNLTVDCRGSAVVANLRAEQARTDEDLGR